jgi:hypothetical protein
MKRPVLYPNATYRGMGKAAAEEDIERCLTLAKDADLQENATGKVAKRTAAGGAKGGAAGAAGGAVFGRPGKGAAAGAAGAGAGALVGGVLNSREPDPLLRRYVNICLQERGYQIVGWK